MASNIERIHLHCKERFFYSSLKTKFEIAVGILWYWRDFYVYLIKALKIPNLKVHTWDRSASDWYGWLAYWAHWGHSFHSWVLASTRVLQHLCLSQCLPPHWQWPYSSRWLHPHIQSRRTSSSSEWSSSVAVWMQLQSCPELFESSLPSSFFASLCLEGCGEWLLLL